MLESDIYIKDTFGLKELEKNDRLYMKFIPDKDHCRFSFYDMFTDFIPFLYQKDWPVRRDDLK